MRLVASRTTSPSTAGGGREVVATREPGGSPGAEAIRELVLKGSADRWSPVTETLLMYAAAARPCGAGDPAGSGARRLGGLRPVCRFHAGLSGRGGRRAGWPDRGAGDLHPGRHRGFRTWPLIFDLPVEVGLERAHIRAGTEMRFEPKGQAFSTNGCGTAFGHRQGRAGALRDFIDATGSLDEVEARVWAAVKRPARGPWLRSARRARWTRPSRAARGCATRSARSRATRARGPGLHHAWLLDLDRRASRQGRLFAFPRRAPVAGRAAGPGAWRAGAPAPTIRSVSQIIARWSHPDLFVLERADEGVQDPQGDPGGRGARPVGILLQVPGQARYTG